MIESAALCTCGHGITMHDLSTRKADLGQRTACSVTEQVTGRVVRCGCTRFVQAVEIKRAEAICGDTYTWAGFSGVCDLPVGHEGAHECGEGLTRTRWTPRARGSS